MTHWPDMRGLFSKIPWAVVGGVATRLYMPERHTNDLDILVHREDGPRAAEALQKAGYRRLSTLLPGGAAWEASNGVKVDVLELEEPWVREALRAAQDNRDPAGNPVIPLPYFILMKLLSGRVQDLADVTRMLASAGCQARDEARKTVSRYYPDASSDLEQLIRLAELEAGPPGI
jgi:hypothetical protein